MRRFVRISYRTARRGQIHAGDLSWESNQPSVLLLLLLLMKPGKPNQSIFASSPRLAVPASPLPIYGSYKAALATGTLAAEQIWSGISFLRGIACQKCQVHRYKKSEIGSMGLRYRSLRPAGDLCGPLESGSCQLESATSFPSNKASYL